MSFDDWLAFYEARGCGEREAWFLATLACLSENERG